MSLLLNDQTDTFVEEIYNLIDQDYEQEKNKPLSNRQQILSILTNKDILQKISNYLNQYNICPLLKIWLTSHQQLDLVDITNIFNNFGPIQHVDIQNNTGYVLFQNIIHAFVCQQFLHNFYISQINDTINVEFHYKEETHPKFTCKYQIQIENEKGFQVARKIIGSKGCHMKKIISTCLSDQKIDLTNQEIIKLRLRGKGSGYKEGPDQQESNEPLHLCVSSKYQHTYSKACKLVEDHLKKIYQEYNNKFYQNLKIKKQEQKDLLKSLDQFQSRVPIIQNMVKQISC